MQVSQFDVLLLHTLPRIPHCRRRHLPASTSCASDANNDRQTANAIPMTTFQLRTPEAKAKEG
jgi:hypothetical protein